VIPVDYALHRIVGCQIGCHFYPSSLPIPSARPARPERRWLNISTSRSSLFGGSALSATLRATRSSLTAAWQCRIAQHLWMCWDKKAYANPARDFEFPTERAQGRNRPVKACLRLRNRSFRTVGGLPGTSKKIFTSPPASKLSLFPNNSWSKFFIASRVGLSRIATQICHCDAVWDCALQQADSTRIGLN